jgi:hypothetical protein
VAKGHGWQSGGGETTATISVCTLTQSSKRRDRSKVIDQKAYCAIAQIAFFVRTVAYGLSPLQQEATFYAPMAQCCGSAVRLAMRRPELSNVRRPIFVFGSAKNRGVNGVKLGCSPLAKV